MPRMHQARSQLNTVSAPTKSQTGKIDVPDYNLETAPVHKPYSGKGSSGDEETMNNALACGHYWFLNDNGVKREKLTKSIAFNTVDHIKHAICTGSTSHRMTRRSPQFLPCLRA